MGFFGAVNGRRGGGPKEGQKKYMNHVTHRLSSADISIFSPEIREVCYIKKCSYRLQFDT